MLILTTMIGFAVLVMGRQTFWIFVAGLSFALGLIYGEQFLSEQPEWLIILVASLVGLLGALLAYNLQRLAGSIAGFATGWYLTNLIFSYTQPNLGGYTDLVPIAVGAICGISIVVHFEWSAIVLSSLAGAAIIVSGVNATERTKIFLLIAFAFLGAFIQVIWFFQEDGKEKIYS